MSKDATRIGEVDFLRGVAILLMVYFHLIYDLQEFYNYPVVYAEGINYYIGKIAALLFITITGISCSLSRDNFIRGFRILFFAYLITIFTYFYSPENYINFGILHLLGFSILLYSFLKEIKAVPLFIGGTLTIILGLYFGSLEVANPFLYPFGLLTANYRSLDYYPLFPYIGFFLYGIALKKLLYPHKKSLLPYSLVHHPLSKIGRKSLFIYIIHQPILLGILYIIHLL